MLGVVIAGTDPPAAGTIRYPRVPDGSRMLYPPPAAIPELPDMAA
jgi:hypothetical protein